MKVSRCLLILLLLLITAALPFQNDVCTSAVTSGLSICLKTLIPSLFPFFFFSTLLCACAGDMISALSAPLLCPLFGLSPQACRVFILGTLGGFPSGAYLASELYRDGKISRAEAERLPLFCNNAGPMFVLSTVGVHVFSSVRLGLLLYTIHLCASCLLAFLTRPKNAPPKTPMRLDSAAIGSSLPLFSLFSQSLQKSLRTMAIICGNFLVFRVLTFLLAPKIAPGLPSSLIKGALEMTGGLLSLPATGEGLVAASAILGFNGLCVHMQGASSLSEAGLSPIPCLLGKGFTALFSASLMSVWLLLSPSPFVLSKTWLLCLAFILALGILLCRLIVWRRSGTKKRTELLTSVR